MLTVQTFLYRPERRSKRTPMDTSVSGMVPVPAGMPELRLDYLDHGWYFYFGSSQFSDRN